MKISNCATRKLVLSLIITAVTAGTATAGTQTGYAYRNLTNPSYTGGYSNYNNGGLFAPANYNNGGLFGPMNFLGGYPNYSNVNYTGGYHRSNVSYVIEKPVKFVTTQVEYVTPVKYAHKHTMYHDQKNHMVAYRNSGGWVNGMNACNDPRVNGTNNGWSCGLVVGTIDTTGNTIDTTANIVASPLGFIGL